MATCESIEGTTSTSLHHLDDYSLLSILDLLKLQELIKIASVHPRFSALISYHHMIRKYHLNECEPTAWISSDGVVIKFVCEDTNKNEYLSKTYDGSILAIRDFCHMFKQLTIRVDYYSYKHAEAFSYYVNKHCDNVPQQIKIDRRSGETSVNILLKNVTDVIIEHEYGTTAVDQFRADLAFPRMEKLTISYKLNMNYHYPYLTEFILDSWSFVKFNDLLNFMKFNPQLRTVKLPFLHNNTFLTTMSELLPNLESIIFTIHNYEYAASGAIQTARFKNVRNFQIDLHMNNMDYWTSDLSQMLMSTQFDRLESFVVKTYNNNRNLIEFFIEWIAAHTELINVSFDYKELSYQQLIALITPLTQLKALTIVWDERTTLDVLNRFLSDLVTTNSSIQELTVDIGVTRIGRKNVCDNLPHG